MNRRVAQPGRLHRRGLGRQHGAEPRRRQPEQEGELLLDRILRAHHAVLEDAPMELLDGLARIGRRLARDEQGRRLPQRNRAGRIRTQVFHNRRPHQLDGNGDGFELVVAQQLGHHPPGQHAIFAQRSPNLREVIDRRGARFGTRLAAPAGRRFGTARARGGFAASGPPVGQHDGQRHRQPANQGGQQREDHRHQPGRPARRRRLGGDGRGRLWRGRRRRRGGRGGGVSRGAGGYG